MNASTMIENTIARLAKTNPEAAARLLAAYAGLAQAAPVASSTKKKTGPSACSQIRDWAESAQWTEFADKGELLAHVANRFGVSLCTAECQLARSGAKLPRRFKIKDRFSTK